MIGNSDGSDARFDVDPFMLFGVTIVLRIHTFTSLAYKKEWGP
jgi:hypothetical protein